MAINPVTGEDIPAPAPQPDQQPDPFDPLAAAEYWRKKNEESQKRLEGMVAGGKRLGEVAGGTGDDAATAVALQNLRDLRGNERQYFGAHVRLTRPDIWATVSAQAKAMFGGGDPDLLKDIDAIHAATEPAMAKVDPNRERALASNTDMVNDNAIFRESNMRAGAEREKQILDDSVLPIPRWLERIGRGSADNLTMAANTILGPIAGSDDQADIMAEQMAGAARYRGQEARENGYIPAMAEGAATSLVDILGVPVGKAGTIMEAFTKALPRLFLTAAGNASADAHAAGLSGGKANAYGAAMGAAEVLPSMILNKLGIGTIESPVSTAIANGIKLGMRDIAARGGAALGAEYLDELATLFIGKFIGKVSGVDPKAFSADSLIEEVRDTLVQTTMMVGATKGATLSGEYAEAKRAARELPMLERIHASATAATERQRDANAADALGVQRPAGAGVVDLQRQVGRQVDDRLNESTMRVVGTDPATGRPIFDNVQPEIPADQTIGREHAAPITAPNETLAQALQALAAEGMPTPPTTEGLDPNADNAPLPQIDPLLDFTPTEIGKLARADTSAGDTEVPATETIPPPVDPATAATGVVPEVQIGRDRTRREDAEQRLDPRFKAAQEQRGPLGASQKAADIDAQVGKDREADRAAASDLARENADKHADQLNADMQAASDLAEQNRRKQAAAVDQAASEEQRLQGEQRRRIASQALAKVQQPSAAMQAAAQAGDLDGLAALLNAEVAAAVDAQRNAPGEVAAEEPTQQEVADEARRSLEQGVRRSGAQLADAVRNRKRAEAYKANEKAAEEHRMATARIAAARQAQQSLKQGRATNKPPTVPTPEVAGPFDTQEVAAQIGTPTNNDPMTTQEVLDRATPTADPAGVKRGPSKPAPAKPAPVGPVPSIDSVIAGAKNYQPAAPPSPATTAAPKAAPNVQAAPAKESTDGRKEEGQAQAAPLLNAADTSAAPATKPTAGDVGAVKKLAHSVRSIWPDATVTEIPGGVRVRFSDTGRSIEVMAASVLGQNEVKWGSWWSSFVDSSFRGDIKAASARFLAVTGAKLPTTAAAMEKWGRDKGNAANVAKILAVHGPRGGYASGGVPAITMRDVLGSTPADLAARMLHEFNHWAVDVFVPQKGKEQLLALIKARNPKGNYSIDPREEAAYLNFLEAAESQYRTWKEQQTANKLNAGGGIWGKLVGKITNFLARMRKVAKANPNGMIRPDEIFRAIESGDAFKGKAADGSGVDASALDEAYALKEQPAGRSVPTSIDALTNINAAFDLARSKKFNKGRDLKVAMQDRVLAAASKAKVDVTEFSKATEDYIVRVALADTDSAIKSNPNAVGWYDEKVTKALKLVSLIHPEIGTDPKSKLAFVWALAVTSNGMKVDKNFVLAEQAYSKWKTSGKMPTDIGEGTAAKAINKSLGMFNDMLKKHGFEQLEKFMTTMTTVKEAVAFSGAKISGERLTQQVYGSAILGPKIGNGFFSNLYGHFEQLTMDRWLMRTWGRWTGTLIKSNQKQVAAKSQALSDLIDSMTPAQKLEFKSIIGSTLSKDDLPKTAAAIVKASTSKENRIAMAKVGPEAGPEPAASTDESEDEDGESPSNSLGDRLRKVGNALHKYIDGQKEAPSGPPERTNIRKVFSRVLSEAQKSRPNLTMADLQALHWYPEKRLYDTAKSKTDAVDEGYEDSEAPDYANAAEKLARERGVADEDIQRAIKEADNGTGRRAGAVQPEDRGRGASQDGEAPGPGDAGSEGGSRGDRAVDSGSGRSEFYALSAYHGTGNTVPYPGGKLDYSKVNGDGGEGTQNEGWGIYVTSSQRAGEFYREQNTRLAGITVDRAVVIDGRDTTGMGGDEINALIGLNVDPDETEMAVSDIQLFGMQRAMERLRPEDVDRRKVLEHLRDRATVMRTGRQYTVEIPDDNGRNYLDWNKPITEQSKSVRSKVDATIQSLHAKIGPGIIRFTEEDGKHFAWLGESTLLSGPQESKDKARVNAEQAIKDFEWKVKLPFDSYDTGEEVYNFITELAGGPKAASDALNAHGILGNKYLGSEGQGPYHNYVIFGDVPYTEHYSLDRSDDGEPARADESGDDYSGTSIEQQSLLQRIRDGLEPKEVETFAQWDRDARRMLRGDGTERLLSRLERNLAGDGKMKVGPEDQRALRIAFVRAMERGDGAMAARIGWIDDQVGTEVARSLGARRFMISTPEGRREWILSYFASPPAGVRAQMTRAKGNKAKQAAVLDAWRKRMEQAKAELKSEFGVDITSPEIGNQFTDLYSLGALAQALNTKLGLSSWADAIVTNYKLGLLTHPGTHAVNTGGNLVNFAKVVTRSHVEGILGSLFGGKPNAATVSELLPFWQGIAAGFPKAVHAAFRSFAAGEDVTTRTVHAQSMAQSKTQTGPAKTVPGLRLFSTRPMAFADSFFKTWAGYAMVAQEAFRRARTAGMSPDDVRAEVAGALAGPQTGSYMADWENAIKRASEVTFSDLGEQDGWASQAADLLNTASKKFVPLSMILPFINTPISITQQGMALIPPAKAAAMVTRGMIKMFKGEPYGRGNALRDASDLLMGSALMSVIMAALDDDDDKPRITGVEASYIGSRGKAEMEKSGLAPLPYAVRVGDRYYSYKWAVPFAQVVAPTVDAARAWKGGASLGKALDIGMGKAAKSALLDQAGMIETTTDFARGIINIIEDASNEKGEQGFVSVAANNLQNQAVAGTARTMAANVPYLGWALTRGVANDIRSYKSGGAMQRTASRQPTDAEVAAGEQKPTFGRQLQQYADPTGTVESRPPAYRNRWGDPVNLGVQDLSDFWQKTLTRDAGRPMQSTAYDLEILRRARMDPEPYYPTDWSPRYTDGDKKRQVMGEETYDRYIQVAGAKWLELLESNPQVLDKTMPQDQWKKTMVRLKGRAGAAARREVLEGGQTDDERVP
jgi:hypothetical protein